MRKLNQLAIVSAVAAALTAVTAYGQTASSYAGQPQVVTAPPMKAQPQMVDAQEQLKSREEAARLAQTRAVADDKGRPTGAVMYLADPKDRAGGRIQLTEAQRAAEHARYEANKRRRSADSASIAASEPFRARMNEQARAGVETNPVADSASARAGGRTVAETPVVSDERRARDILSELR